MVELLKIKQAIIVEGKYDKIKLSSIVDALIIDVDGFHIFKDKKKCELIKNLAKSCGIIILTDSDHAGNLIRNHINNFVKNGKIYNAYIPEILGKEKRKDKPSSQGLLGVEGVEKDVILSALNKLRFDDFSDSSSEDLITTMDLYRLGISGGENSSLIRAKLLKFLDLPTNLSKNNMIKILSKYTSLEQLTELVAQIKEEIKNGW